MGFELFVALRYLLAPRKQAFISLISIISVLGVAVGVAALVIALALMTGLQGELRDRILGSTPHICTKGPDWDIRMTASAIAQAIHECLLLAAVDFDHRAVDVMRARRG